MSENLENKVKQTDTGKGSFGFGMLKYGLIAAGAAGLGLLYDRVVKPYVDKKYSPEQKKEITGTLYSAVCSAGGAAAGSVVADKTKDRVV